MSGQDYGDFELELEYKLAREGNSGIFLRAWPAGNVSGADFHEIQLQDDTATAFANVADNVRTASLYKQIAAKPVLRPVPDEWHHLKISVNGNELRVHLNDKQVVEGKLPAGKRDRGRIGLQINRSRVDFRNVRLQDLK